MMMIIVAVVIAVAVASAAVFYSQFSSSSPSSSFKKKKDLCCPSSLPSKPEFKPETCFRFTDESLRWLAANGRVKQVERILKKAAAVNRVKESDVLKVFRTRVLKQVTAETKHEQSDGPSLERTIHGDDTLGSPLVSDRKTNLPTYGVQDFFKHKHVFMCIVINGFVW